MSDREHIESFVCEHGEIDVGNGDQVEETD
jgi:hypothetical protein